MSQSVLAAVDLDHDVVSAEILRRAASIAEQDDAQLSVITVVPELGPSYATTFFENDDQRKPLEAAQAGLHKLVDRILPDHGPMHHVVGSGSIYEKVLEAAGAVDADLIVIGAAKPGAAVFLLGPNAERVARHFAGSVLIVR
ncbi:MAG: universal stress protein [Pikeienuella sp.]